MTELSNELQRGTDAGPCPAVQSLPPRLPLMLCYHKVDQRWELGVTRISPRRFARQIGRFARDGWTTLSLSEVIACVRGQRAAGPRELAIMFDDGYRALRSQAFPVLQEHGYSAICSLITDYAGRMNRWDVAYGGRRFAHLTWRDVDRWQSRSIEFISHSATHPRLTWLTDGEVRAELARSRCAIERAGCDTHAVSYPFGAHGERELRFAREAGYEVGFTLAHDWCANEMAVPRLPVYMWAPARPGMGVLARAERHVAIIANACSVGTTLWQRTRARGTRPIR
jgi:peptidoglycan/xylan/chitin deacetylase (PgdA/CDA1 family)